jgi:hypothetical protein
VVEKWDNSTDVNRGEPVASRRLSSFVVQSNCHDQAARLLTPDDKQEWLKIAEQWWILAEATEQSEPTIKAAAV